MLARIAVPRRLPAFSSTVLRAAYSTGRVEGSTAQSKEFSKKERAHEDQYARQHEAEQLKKLREQIEKKRQELAQLEQEHSEISSKK
ncbi:hypothetical protein GLOTRDRAFT_128909 [Gloeophyllum trabeum ATCC 11539]|uniref:ATPase inhibitor, mitochondrial n=1 Tax=Gloeophyllum trabeum (strain ATCC 11539 / FP-39264 / Madison 617) TaxID=670483 RepID=S7Q6M0_GLOTA|nr:uncharacterized protein GLOTRDRAFT_128909 [Gloeophyllum trabeum ATCC 11539]EPQ55696.1 hypothetical protein GLOTRDRAFT_128909 [Gloeophyllum trabeum ATCC 11539]